MRKRSLLCCFATLGSGVLTPASDHAAAPLQWTWRYAGAGISASGTLTTSDAQNSAGYFQITEISGSRNGVKIVRLQPTGTAIPGNEPYAVDNLIGLSGPQLTEHGLGFALADGTFVNPFFAQSNTPANYLEFFSAAHAVPGVAGPDHSELPISFTAERTTRGKQAY